MDVVSVEAANCRWCVEREEGRGSTYEYDGSKW